MKLRRFTSAGGEMARQYLAAVHEVKQTYSDSWTFLGPDGSFDLGDIYLPMGDSDLWGDWDCRDWLKSHEDAVALREEYGSKFYIKKDLRMLAHNQTGCAGVLSAAEAIRTSVLPRVNDSKIELIIGKIARGLATFLAGMWVSDIQCEMMILPKLSHEERMAFEESQGHEVWPEVGSRLMQMMVVCDHDVLMSQWEVCQKDRFRYMIIQMGDYCEVRMVFSEYLGVVARCG